MNNRVIETILDQRRKGIAKTGTSHDNLPIKDEKKIISPTSTGDEDIFRNVAIHGPQINKKQKSQKYKEFEFVEKMRSQQITSLE